ncbi:hypothetical protein BDP27DRAFT_1425422 [Rhodocollybia butyracea]|uniref:Uncharacterized protein n=1 Tax=Rhodocollybia butyracea TaxID=206335 RepID=A0A9P5U3S5_9AGAR|nr:hypothetical protein BDP27DRAFT_1425422 [Rhodocollybia butyracea]
MGDSGDDSDEYMAPPPPRPREVLFTDMLATFDDTRDRMLEGLPIDATFSQFSKEKVQQYIDLVLSGVGVDGTQYAITAPPEEPEAYHEARCSPQINSVFIFGNDHFPWDSTFDIYPLYSLEKCHTESLYVRVDFMPLEDPGSHSNILWGVCDQQHPIYLMLPDMPKDKDLKIVFPFIFQATLAAAKEKIPTTASQWNLTHEVESDSTWRVPGTVHGVAFANKVMDNIREHSWGRCCYWFIHMDGTQNLPYNEINQTDEVVDDLLIDVDRATSIVFLDVALEVHLAQGYASLPGRLNNLHLGLATNVWGISIDEWKMNWRNYELDVWAGNAYIAGFRYDFSHDPVTNNMIYYAQVHTSDILRADSPTSLPLLASQILRMPDPDHVPVQMNKSYQLFSENQIISTVVCLEARVPAERAGSVYTQQLKPNDLSDYIFAVPLECLWAWRLHRMTACCMLLRYSASVLKSSRSDIQHLTLVVAAVQCFNSICSHRGISIWDKPLAKAVFPTATLAESSSNYNLMLWAPQKNRESVPILSRGALWLPPIVFPKPREGDVLRFEYNGYRLSEEHIGKLLGTDWARIQQSFLPYFMVDRYASGDLCRRRCAPSSEVVKRRIELPDHVKDFSLRRPRLLYHDTAPDLPRESHVGSYQGGVNWRNASEFCLGILSQIMERVGTSGAGIPYCNLTKMECKVVSLDTFRDMNLKTYFTSYQYTTTKSDWVSLRTILFPGHQDSPPLIFSPNVQGWKRLPLYMEYLALRETNPHEFVHLQRTCMAIFDTLKWFVKVHRDKLINYERQPKMTAIFSGTADKGVHIAFNPIFGKPHITTHRNRSPVLDQNAIRVLDSEEAAIQDALAEHQIALPPFVRAVYGSGSRNRNASEPEELLDSSAVLYARVLAHKKKGYLDPAIYDPALSEDEVEGILIGF